MRHLLATVLPYGLCLALAACAGSGGEALVEQPAGDTDRPSRLPEPGIGAPPTAWSGTQEYQNSNGLALINAAEGYANRTTGAPAGEGVRVAVLDTGVAAGLQEFDRLERFNFAGDTADAVQDHATHVAGTIAARRDGVGVHGVAYNATLVSIKTLRDFDTINGVTVPSGAGASEIEASILSAAGRDRTLYRYDMVNANEAVVRTGGPLGQTLVTWGTAPAAESSIMNMSFGGPDPARVINPVDGSVVQRFPVYNAMVTAAQAGKIMVAALGNDAAVGASAAPAAYVDQAAIDGHALAVGALDSSGTGRASFSNSCGGLQFCLFAPGTSVLSTTFDDTYGTKSGTSMAAPHVAGALAVLKSAFPNQSAKALVNRVLTTAHDLGDTFTFGAGRLDLAAAMSPVGALSVPLGTSSTGPSAPLSTASLSLPPGTSATALREALGRTLLYDEQRFQFFGDLGARVQEARQDDGFLADFVERGAPGLVRGGRVNDWLGVSIVSEPEDLFALSLREEGLGNQTDDVEAVAVALALAPGSSFHYVEGGPRARLVQERLGLTGSGSFTDDAIASPFAHLQGVERSAGFREALGDGTAYEVGFFQGEGYGGAAETRGVQLGLASSWRNLSLGVDGGYYTEDGAAVGLDGDGAFGSDLSARTAHATLFGDLRLDERFSLFGSYTFGRARSDRNDSGLVRSVEAEQLEAFGAGLRVENLLGDDGLAVSVSQPLRVRRGGVELSVPTGDDPHGNVSREVAKVDMAGDAETLLQLGYRRRLAGVGTMGAGAFYRTNPGGYEDEADELGFAVHFGARF